MSQKTPHVVVIGGGAAGFFGALRLRELMPDVAITLLESGQAPLAKVKISGGGRCNVTHSCFDVDRLITFYPRGGKSLKSMFHTFGPGETVEWFEDQGVPLKTEKDGRMFPTTDSSQTIVDCLMNAALRGNINIQCRTPVRGLKHEGNQWEVLTSEGVLEADAILLASGGAPIPLSWLKGLGHQLTPQVPSLFTFNVQHPLLKDMAGISFPWIRATLTHPELKKGISHEGPMLITHWGLSGPAIIGLSAKGARLLHSQGYHASLKINFFPTGSAQALRDQVTAFKDANPRRTLANGCPWELPRRIWERLLDIEELAPEKPWMVCPNKPFVRLSEALVNYPFEVRGKGQFKEEFVTAGGVPLLEIDLKTMGSKIAPGLFFAGEVIDVDGLTGGFNFQNAWTTGWIAAEGISRYLCAP